jgi:hypothetical protein
MFKFFWKNQSNKLLIFGIPLIFALLSFITKESMDYGNIITAFSIILMLNVTALFQISKNVLAKLFRTTNKNGDSYYKILKNKYEVVIYSSFVYIAFLLLVNFVDFSGMDSKRTLLLIGTKIQASYLIISFIVLYFLCALIILNAMLVKYYFETLYAELKSN